MRYRQRISPVYLPKPIQSTFYVFKASHSNLSESVIAMKLSEDDCQLSGAIEVSAESKLKTATCLLPLVTKLLEDPNDSDQSLRHFMSFRYLVNKSRQSLDLCCSTFLDRILMIASILAIATSMALGKSRRARE